MADRVGTVCVLRPRAYMKGADWVDVPPGDYPLYCHGDVFWWEMTGRIDRSEVRTERVPGSGLFVMSRAAQPSRKTKVESPRFGPTEWAELLASPVAVDGPDQRIRITVAPGVSDEH